MVGNLKHINSLLNIEHNRRWEKYFTYSENGTDNENKGTLEILKAIIKQADRKNLQEKQQRLKPLLQAIYSKDNQDAVKSMAPEKESFFGTPLEIAVLKGFIQAAELLIDIGADFRTQLDQYNRQ